MAAYVSFSSGASACHAAEGERVSRREWGEKAAGQGMHHVQHHLRREDEEVGLDAVTPHACARKGARSAIGCMWGCTAAWLEAALQRTILAFLDRLVEAWARKVTVMSKALGNAGEQRGSEERGAPNCSFCEAKGRSRGKAQHAREMERARGAGRVRGKWRFQVPAQCRRAGSLRKHRGGGCDRVANQGSNPNQVCGKGQ